MALRQIAGDIDGNGNIVRGTGDFTVEHFATGHYQIIFAPRFNRIISVVATQVPRFDGSTLDNVVIINFGDEECRLKTGGSNGNAQDRGFCFIALGE